jgi:hypothetical protein
MAPLCGPLRKWRAQCKNRALAAGNVASSRDAAALHQSETR